jgi:hypothetical protein
MIRLAILAALSASPAAAQSCGERDAILAALADRFGETLAFTGLGHNGKFVVELTTSPAGSWTLLHSTPGGATCLMASGYHYETPDAAPDGDPA